MQTWQYGVIGVAPPPFFFVHNPLLIPTPPLYLLLSLKIVFRFFFRLRNEE